MLCLSFHIPCSQNFFYLYCFFTWACSTGLALKFHEWATCISFYNPLKFPETESKHLWLLCHFLFYSHFCISAPTPVTLAAVYFLKRGLGLLFSFILIILFYHYFHFNLMHLRHLKISSKNSAKIIQPISQWVLIESIFDWMKSWLCI